MGGHKQLTAKQRAFVEHYLVSENAYESALKAGYSEQYAKSKSYLLLEHPAIAARIERRQRELLRRMVRPEKVLATLAALGQADPRDYVDVEGGVVMPKDLAEIPPAKRVAIAGIKDTQYGVSVQLVRPSERVRALELLCKLTGLFDQPANLETEEEPINPMEGLTTEELREILKRNDGEP